MLYETACFQFSHLPAGKLDRQLCRHSPRHPHCRYGIRQAAALGPSKYSAPGIRLLLPDHHLQEDHIHRTHKSSSVSSLHSSFFGIALTFMFYVISPGSLEWSAGGYQASIHPHLSRLGQLPAGAMPDGCSEAQQCCRPFGSEGLATRYPYRCSKFGQRKRAKL